MKLPSLPRPTLTAAGFLAGMPPWRNVLLGALAFLMAFLLGFLLAFPTAPLRQKLLDSFRQHQATAELQSLTLSPLLALQGRGLTLRMDHTSLPPLAVERFTVRPLWLSLLSKEPGLHIDAELLQGTLQAAVHRGGRLHAEASGLHFALPLREGTATVTGSLASGRLQRAASAGQAAEQTLSLSFGELLVQSPLLASTASRPLNLGQLRLEGNGRGQTFNVTRLESSGGDVGLSGTGSLLLGRTLESSRLNLNLVLRPAASLPGDFRALLTLLGPPAGDGSYPLQISGTLASPQLQSPGGRPAPEAPPRPLEAAPAAENVAPAVQDQGVERGGDGPSASAFGGNRRRAAESRSDDEE
jgi:type II secretion system protein N